MRRRPAATRSPAIALEQVAVGRQREVVEALDRGQHRDQLREARAARAARRRSAARRVTPIATNSRTRRSISSKREDLGAVEPGQALGRHAVLAAEVAAVGDGDPQVADQAAVTVAQRLACRMDMQRSLAARSVGCWARAPPNLEDHRRSPRRPMVLEMRLLGPPPEAVSGMPCGVDPSHCCESITPSVTYSNVVSMRPDGNAYFGRRCGGFERRLEVGPRHGADAGRRRAGVARSARRPRARRPASRSRSARRGSRPRCRASACSTSPACMPASKAAMSSPKPERSIIAR